jgi:hypothetical protein
MSAKPNYITEVVVRSFISLICCMVIGYIFYESRIFNRHASTFSILVYGLIGSIFFYTMRIDIKNAFAALLVLFVIDSAFITHATRLSYLLRDIFCIGALSTAIYTFYQYFYNKSKNERWLEPLILSALVAVFALVATLILVIINRGLNVVTFQWIYYITKLYFLIGLGIGIGIILTEEPYLDKILMYFRNFFSN